MNKAEMAVVARRHGTHPQEFKECILQELKECILQELKECILQEFKECIHKSSGKIDTLNAR